LYLTRPSLSLSPSLSRVPRSGVLNTSSIINYASILNSNLLAVRVLPTNDAASRSPIATILRIRTPSAISRESRGDVDLFAASRQEKDRERQIGGHSSVEHRACATCNVQESRRRVETSGCFGKVHPRSLHPPAPPHPRSSPYRRWRLRPAPYRAECYSITTARRQSRARVDSRISPFLLGVSFLAPPPRKSISGLLRHPRHRSIGLL